MTEPVRPLTASAFRHRLRTGPPVLSTFVKLDSLEVVDVLAATAVDLVIVDLEHSQLDEGAGRRLVRHATALGLPALVRVPEVDAGAINRLLEAGAQGIQLSALTSTSQADALQAACRYPPAGRRSVSLAQPGAEYGAVGLADLIDPARSPVVIGQVETAATRSPLPELIRDLDAVFVGVTDLSVDLGETSFDAPAVAARLREIAGAAAAAGIPLGGWLPALDRAGMLGSDARLLAVGSDLGFLRSALDAAFPSRPHR